MQRRWVGFVAGLLMVAVSLTAISVAGARSTRHGRLHHSTRQGRLHGVAAREVALFNHMRAQSSTAALQAHAPSGSSSASGGTSATSGSSAADDSFLAAEAAQYSNERTAPAATVSGAALLSAAKQAAALPDTPGGWQELTNVPYNAQPSNYTDPAWSNAIPAPGAGWADVSGRITALTETPDGTWFAGAADGGVWRSTDKGTTWTPVFDSQASLSIGALAVDPVGGALWVGTGESNTNQDSYAGTGVYRSTDDGTTWQPVTNTDSTNPIVGRTVFRIAFDPAGDAYAATNNGLFRYDATSGNWSDVLHPAKSTDPTPFYTNQVTDVAVVPGSDGTDVIAAVGWRSADLLTNGFYKSTDGGHTFSMVTVSGDIKASDIGRTTFAYSADGSKLYAIVQSPSMLNAGATSNLLGVFRSSGTPASVAGPWTKIADGTTLMPGSASPYGANSVGAQAWYNQTLAVDPSNPKHLYMGLEEMFESTDAGKTWVTASPYWNFGLACNGTLLGCPNGTHPDQHALMIADGKVVIGNDGGVFSRPLSDTQQYGDWTDLTATLNNLQYYDARAGMLSAKQAPPSGGVGVVGGLQDNGTSFLQVGASPMVEPAGGDGFDVIVDPANAYKFVGEYTDGDMYSTTDGGHSFFDPVSPGCFAQTNSGLKPRKQCDNGMRFVTPLVPDEQNVNTWVTGGQDVWVSSAGWNTSCTHVACTWKNLYELPAGDAVTALTSTGNGSVIYAAWVAGGGNPGPAFGRGIATNYGGKWHQLSMAGLPPRYIAGVTVDASNPAHAYAVFNGYSRRWIPAGGVGHVFETNDGGQTWTDISGDLPDIPSDALVMHGGQLELATDLGMYTATEGQGAATSWSVLGTGLPDASVNDVTLGPNGFYAATHGRGIWMLPY